MLPSIDSNDPLLSNLKEPLCIATKTAVSRFCICKHFKCFLINVSSVLCNCIQSIIPTLVSFSASLMIFLKYAEPRMRRHRINASLIKILELRIWSDMNELGVLPSVWLLHIFNAIEVAQPFFVLYVFFIYSKRRVFTYRN